MVRKPGLKRFVEWIEEDFVLYFHWVLALAPVAAIILGALFGSATHIMEALFGMAAIAVNFALLGLRSRIEENPELTLFRTFWSGTILPPSQPAKELLFNTEVAIIEADEDSYYGEAVHEKFQTRLKATVDKGDREPDEDQRLRLTQIHCGSPDAGLDPPERESAIATLKDSLANAISKSEAVVVVRTNALDQKPWVIEALHNWAKNDVEAPMLVVRPSKRKEPYKSNELMDKFWWIRDNAKALPWNLVKRARDRAVGWRSQATYNRAMAINFCLLALMSLVLGVIVFSRQRDEHAREMQPEKDRQAAQLRIEQLKAEAVDDGMREARSTLAQYEKEILGVTDENLNISYWFRHNGDPYVFVTTEKASTKNSFCNNKSSLIGCGFVEPWGRLVEWQGGGKTKVFEFSGREIHGHGCEMDPRVEPIKAIVCSAYQPSGVNNPEETVGICIFTGSESRRLLSGGYKEFLQKRTKSFYEGFKTRIENHLITALADRPKSAQ